MKSNKSATSKGTKQPNMQDSPANEQQLINYVADVFESIGNDKACPHCNSEAVFKWGIRNNMQRYKCKKCKKSFNTLTATPLAHLRKKESWLKYAECLREGLSIRKAAAKCGIHKNTSHRWRHRFRKINIDQVI